MASIYQLKSRFQDLLRPLVGWMAGRGITANQVTVSAIVLSALGGGALTLWPEAGWPFLLLPVILFLRMALNAIDGMLAREHDMRSALGAVLNELGDVVSDLCLYLPFALLAGASPALVIGICLLAVIGEMTGVIGVQIGASRRYDGPMGKSDRAVVFGTLGVLIGFGLGSATVLNVILALTLVLAAVTVLNRARMALREVATS
ncbi:CDP-alcohol phosphatidyltransferase family protein [Stappia taiwanensis]|uniref:CDP-alcohol phosphatidyltransferase family protein n=1 Tax=Stappia taiwanensis TaxID=992267 RepID=A0A838XTU2_9HYPH|nr:CDP-alcohol phosphatidyltransferase family protein [Stappia taiwanensis]MBA4610474.1 CDP-alcohol phosphatidyltransferase family protein [Stappia taiwanensis]GGE84660.1 CDP-alcohol phosphatidyltransferase [Stappia taiwanensis]